MVGGTRRGVSRRSLLSLGGGAVVAPLAGGLAGAARPEAAKAAEPTGAVKHVTVGEGTNIAPSVSPDGKSVAFDLYGVLWVVGIGGGGAKRLTDDYGDIAMPDWTPDSKTLVFQSYRSGTFQLWSVGADGSGLKQLTDGPFDAREPRVSPDGTKVVFSSDRNNSYGLYILTLATGAIATLADTTSEEYEPAWSPDGKSVAFTVDKTRIDVVELTGARRTVVPAPAQPGPDPAELRSPAFSRDGASVIYTAVTTGASRLMRNSAPLVEGEDVFPFRVSWLSADEYVYASNGKIRRRKLGETAGRPIEFSATAPVTTPKYTRKPYPAFDYKPKPVIGIGSPRLSPDGKSVVFRALNELYLMPIGGKPQPLTKDLFHKSDPDFSPDGKWLSYSSDKGGKLDIWIRELATGAERQLTKLPDAAVSGSWSNDGKLIAFLDQNGAVYVVEVETGAVKRIHPAMWEPGRPTFSPDGKVVALSAFKPYSARYREGQSEILTIDRETGESIYQSPLPHRSLGSRGDDGPIWSPDGKSIALVIGSRLHVAPVDGRGKLTAPPKPINNEVTDAPSWSGDSKTILYLCNGKLRLIPAAGGAARTIPVPLTWAKAQPKGRVLVRAGKLWDGHGPETRTNVDILIENGRIVSVTPQDGKPVPAGVKLVDASGLTVMPGLIDIHTHRQMQGYSYGDRQGRLWLSFGVTTTRSPGSPAYHAIEERESIESGARIGPRYFTTGEAIDGSRIYYNFMRPVQDEGQLELELSRAEALGYDLMKSYVRAPLQQQKLVAEWGHRRGIPTTSHYHYPAANFGLDGMEHLGATSRFGYSRTISPAGVGYEDVISLFVQAGMRRTPTIFQAAPLLAEDPGLANDPRVRALYPSWERAKLIARTDQAKAAGPAADALLAKCVAQIKDMLRSGGKVTSGTDSPIDLNVVSLHMNLRAMTKYGLSPYEALLTATRYSGEFLEAPIGVIEAGALADLNIVEGDPLARIEDAAKVRYVLKEGTVYTPDELMAPFASPGASAALHGHSPMLPPTPIHASSADYWWHSAEYVESGRHACCADVFSLGAFSKPKPAVKGRFSAVEVV
jgi:Tol biopolymer transport system component